MESVINLMPMTEAERERAAIVAWLRERGQNMRRYPFESATMAEAMVLAARELANIADLLERGEHMKGTGDE